jgi:ABC-type multidrug transport system fused ATPase/permease subunit
MIKVQEAMSERVGMAIFLLANFLVLVGQSFYFGWKLSLVLTMVIPILAGAVYCQSRDFTRLTAKELEAYAEAGSVAEEVLTNIRTVTAFNAQERERGRYDVGLISAKKFAMEKACRTGFWNGLDWLICFLNYALAFWYGTILVIRSRESGDGLYGPDTVVVVRTL